MAELNTLSGGQKRKVALAKVLAEDADILLLDEPTNHLDEEMILWLEDYLRAYRGVVLIVTHDRYFFGSGYEPDSGGRRRKVLRV